MRNGRKGEELTKSNYAILSLITCILFRLHNERLYVLYSSPNINQVIKSRRPRSAGHVARAGERRSAYRDLVGKPEERRTLERPWPRWEIILIWILE
jgi:hypothetical protein